MTQPKPKHAGCCDCKSTDQEILSSITIPGEVIGKAICEDCRKKRGIKKGGWK